MKSPEHPGQPQWQTLDEWVQVKTPQSVDYLKSAQETKEEQFERFRLVEEDGGGWGDASQAEDAGWGLPDTSRGGW